MLFREIKAASNSQQVSFYTKEQAIETAKWWFQIVTKDLPVIISTINKKEINYPKINEEQEKLFVTKLTDLIWNKINHPHHLGGTYFRIHFNRDNWDLVEEAMKCINLSINIDQRYLIKLMTQLEQNGKASYQNGNDFGDIYRPDAEPLKHHSMKA